MPVKFKAYNLREIGEKAKSREDRKHFAALNNVIRPPEVYKVALAFGREVVTFNVIGHWRRPYQNHQGLGTLRVDCVNILDGIVPLLNNYEQRRLRDMLSEKVATVIAPVELLPFSVEMMDLES